MKSKLLSICLIFALILLTVGCTLTNQVSTAVPTQVTPSSPQPTIALTETLSASPTVMPSQPVDLTPTPVPLPTDSSSPPIIRLDAPLGLGLLEGADFDFLAQHLRSDDYVVVHTRNVKALDRVPDKKRMLILTPEDVKNMSDTLALADSNDITLISYNLEGQLTREELVDGERTVYDQINAAGFPFMFGPMVTHLMRYYADFANNADAIIIQSQRMQVSDDYGERVKELIANLKAANPDIQVWVQISIVPPPDRNVPIETVLKEIASIADSVDGLFLFYTVERWDAVKEIISVLRP